MGQQMTNPKRKFNYQLHSLSSSLVIMGFSAGCCLLSQTEISLKLFCSSLLLIQVLSEVKLSD